MTGSRMPTQLESCKQGCALGQSGLWSKLLTTELYTASQPFCSNFRSSVLSAVPCCPHRTHLTPKRRCSHCLFPAIPKGWRQAVPILDSKLQMPALTCPHPEPAQPVLHLCLCLSPGQLLAPCPGLPAVIAPLLRRCSHEHWS